MNPQSAQTKSRFKKILEFKKTHNLIETGKKFKLSPERIRQILFRQNQKFCTRHKRLYFNKCSYCLNRKYNGYVRKLTYKSLLLEVKKESLNPVRDDVSVYRRLCLIVLLRNRYKLSFPHIGKLLNRDHTTIMHSYGKYHRA